MFNLILIATGGALGSVLRYLLTLFSKTLFSSSIYGTVSVNIIGCFLIGYFITSNVGNHLSENFIKFFFIIGLLGSFTTFSAFSYEAIDLFLSEKYILTFFYILSSICLCLLGAYFGIYINKSW